jgi:hypothetical protein
MARIRSVHPGLFTDENFVQVSDAAKVLYIGILTECDDQGAFDWKPITLRLRVCPFDTEVEKHLQELLRFDMLTHYELEGRKYGAVRNFCRFQSPKKPRYVHPVTPAIRTYVGLSTTPPEPAQPELIEVPPDTPLNGNHFHTSGEPVPHQTPTGGENRRQGKERKGEEGKGIGESTLGVCVESPPPRAGARTHTRARKIPLPDDWFPSPAAADYCDELPLSDEQVGTAFTNFTNFYRSRGATMADWDSAWKMWLDGEVKKLGAH